MLLSDRDIRAELDKGRVLLEPYDAEMVQPSSVDVRLDRFFRVFENHRYPHIDPSVEQAELTRLVQPDGEEPFILHPGEFALASTYEVITLPDDIAARLEGKALAVDTPVPTPNGWRTMGDLQVGDEVFDAAGRACLVVAATDVMDDRDCGEVVFSDGQSVVADLQHQWLTTTKADRGRRSPAAVRTTAEIRSSLRAGDEWNHHVPLVSGPVQYARRDLPIDPYVLGVWLGNGTGAEAEVTPADADGRVPREPERTEGSLLSALQGLGLLGDKHVPVPYLVAAPDQRLALLQGLMDSDGDIDKHGRCEFVNANEALADAVLELAASLGLRPVKRKKEAKLYGVDCGPAYQVAFTPHLQVFRLSGKLLRQKSGTLHAHRSVIDVRQVTPRPVRCIQVSAPHGLFLVGQTFIPTHNSSLGRLGLLTHSTAGFIDPGFSGHVTLELSNVATLPIKLWPGMKIGQLCMFRLSSPAEHPYGSSVYGSRYQGQRGPTPSRSFQNFHRTDVRRP